MEFLDDLQSVTEEPICEPISNREIIKRAIAEINDPLLPKLLLELARTEGPLRRAEAARRLGVERQSISSVKKKVNNWFVRNHLKELIKGKRVRTSKGWARNYELSNPRFREWIVSIVGNPNGGVTNAGDSPTSS